MKPRTTAMLLAGIGILLGGASGTVISALLGPETTPTNVSGTTFRAALAPPPSQAVTRASGVVKAGPAKAAAGMSLAVSTRIGPADEVSVEGARASESRSPKPREHAALRRDAQGLVPGREAESTADWLPVPPPAKPKLALAGDPDRAAEELATNGGAEVAHAAVPATFEGLDSIHQPDVARALVQLPQRSPDETSKTRAADPVTALLPEADWAEVLRESELGDLRGAGVDQVVMDLTGDTTVNDQTSAIDARMTLDPNGNATLDGTLPGTVLEDGVRVETVLNGMNGFNGLAQVIQVPGSGNVVNANLLINMYVLMSEGVLPPNLVDLSAALR